MPLLLRNRNGTYPYSVAASRPPLILDPIKYNEHSQSIVDNQLYTINCCCRLPFRLLLCPLSSLRQPSLLLRLYSYPPRPLIATPSECTLLGQTQEPNNRINLESYYMYAYIHILSHNLTKPPTLVSTCQMARREVIRPISIALSASHLAHFACDSPCLTRDSLYTLDGAEYEKHLSILGHNHALEALPY